MVEREVLAKAAELFNRKLYFECHDVLEEEWAGTRGPERALLNGLIHAAVGMYHVAAGNYAGARSQLEKAVRILESYRSGESLVDLPRLLGALERCLAKVEKSRGGESIAWEAGDVPEMVLT